MFAVEIGLDQDETDSGIGTGTDSADSDQSSPRAQPFATPHSAEYPLHTSLRYRTDTYSVPLSSTHRRLPTRPGDFPPDASASASSSACATLDSRRPLRVRFADQPNAYSSHSVDASTSPVPGQAIHHLSPSASADTVSVICSSRNNTNVKGAEQRLQQEIERSSGGNSFGTAERYSRQRHRNQNGTEEIRRGSLYSNGPSYRNPPPSYMAVQEMRKQSLERESLRDTLIRNNVDEPRQPRLYRDRVGSVEMLARRKRLPATPCPSRPPESLSFTSPSPIHPLTSFRSHSPVPIPYVPVNQHYSYADAPPVRAQLVSLSPCGYRTVIISKNQAGPFGFFIAHGILNGQPGIFISRLTLASLSPVLSVGDEILYVDGEWVRGASLELVQSLIRGKTSISLVLFPSVGSAAFC
ncbi:hypothetical protein WR25_21326 [Diploscapter pachys]|uniref:PDZ domain-containing protein n=1 Tax=Diploscapter pachys TaxID=2018661 RepID=A0A2A2J4C3_9BILA|nr:hypothetical protein WR25_21326 [Diploscapter pachys]